MDDALDAVRARAGWLSLWTGAGILLGKLGTWALTDSSAVLSDAMESTVNVAAAGLLVFSLRVAARPADRGHPYGHGKVELFSAGIEGALILGAGALVVVSAVRDLVVGPTIRHIDAGLALLLALSAVNALLGWHLLRVGRRARSPALVADGRHVLTDVWTSAGVLVGLAAVRVTGWVVLDPLVALAAAANILAAGGRLVRDSVHGLMDAADEPTLQRLVDALEGARESGWIDVHGLRAWRAGSELHADLHMTVPRYFDVETLHRIHERVESALLPGGEDEGDVVVHFDPCRREHCPRCAVAECPVREADFVAREPFSLGGAAGPTSR